MSDTRAPKEYHRNRFTKAADVAMGRLSRAGLVPRAVLLTVRGRTSGEPRSTPVTPIEQGGRVWLVSPYGSVSWVRNLRAAGELTLSRRRTTRHFAAREATPDEAGPVLKRYVAVAPLTVPYFAAEPDAPAGEFAAEAGRHPVFELTPLGSA